MRKDKIFELKIEEDDDLSGIDSISLVDEPAIEVNWVAFKKDKEHEFHIPDGHDKQYLEKLFNYGQSEEELFNDGWEVVKENFISSDPNGDSLEDTGEYLIRYKYSLNPLAPGSPIKSTTREFCSDLLNKNFVYRVEDLDSITNDEGDSAMVWRGGYNCRHIWNKITYRRGTDIVNKASVTKGRVEGPGDNDVLGYPQPDTRVPEWPSFQKMEKFAGEKVSIDYDDTLSTNRGKLLAKRLLSEGKDLYIVTRRREELLGPVKEVAKELGISLDKIHATNGKLKWETIKRLGIQTHYDNNEDEIKAIKLNLPTVRGIKFDYNVGTVGGYVDPGLKKKVIPKSLVTGGTTTLVNKFEEQFQYLFQSSHSDYPDSVKNNAKAVLKYVDENGWGDCGTDVGKQRANQLANGEPISEDTIRRMYSYLSRHEVDLESSKGYGDGCGKLMYDSWGGKTALSWAESKINQVDKEKMSKQYFQVDSEEKRIVLGPAMIPEQKIYRKDRMGNPYYVYFTSDTIKMIADKYMRNQYTRNNDLMHDGTAVPDVYVSESWIKEDSNDKSVKYGYSDLPVGTWFVSMKVAKTPEGDKVWNMVKEGKLNGFSVSGYFEEVAQFSKEEMFLYKLVEVLKEIKE
jgi:hypothetical protein